VVWGVGGGLVFEQSGPGERNKIYAIDNRVSDRTNRKTQSEVGVQCDGKKRPGTE